ncbi:MAG: MFS transporter [Firmicutes bacterium]|nr:MFS transporter [Bacillota bacterium]
MEKLQYLERIKVSTIFRSFYLNRYKKRSRVQKLFILDGVVINAAIVLTSGIFLSGYIVLLGGSDFLTGLLNNSLGWASVVALASSLLFERMKRRKKIIITFNILSRLLVCSTIFLPLIIYNNKITLFVLTIMVITGNILWSFFSTGNVVWMMNTVPKDTRKEFIYARMFWLRISFTLFTIVMGFILDALNKSYVGFFIVFVTSLVLSIIDAVILINIEEPENSVNGNKRVNSKQIFEPWENKEYRQYLIFVLLFYLGLFTSVSYTPLYLIRYMEFDYKFISSITVLSYIFMIVSTNFWSKIEWKKGIKFVLRVGAFFIIAEVLVYAFLTKQTYFLLFIASIMSGIGNGGFNVALLNYRYDLMPEDNRTIYESWFGAVYGLGTILAPVLGGYLLGHLPLISNAVSQYGNFQLLYLITFIFDLIIVFVFFGIKQKDKNLCYNVERNRGVNFKVEHTQ